MTDAGNQQEIAAIGIIAGELDKAIAAAKCHQCGCLQQTVTALSTTSAGRSAGLAGKLAEARATFTPKRYDCLGCSVCYPAIAANAFVEAFPEAGASLDLCPTEEPELRDGWPPLPGDYHVLRYRAPVAVCTLNGAALAAGLHALAPDGLSIVGTMHTENLGIERLIKNTITNPHIRFLVLCGEDTQQAVGHLPGQSLESLFENGVDERGRIRGARGKRPVLKNVTAEEIEGFRRQVELVARISEGREAVIAEEVRRLSLRDPGPYAAALPVRSVETVQGKEPKRLTLDKAGYLVVYPDPRCNRLMLEHYSNDGVLDCVIEGATPAALYATAIERGLLTRLDHAAYLGRELARAEQSLRTGEHYVQDARRVYRSRRRAAASLALSVVSRFSRSALRARLTIMRPFIRVLIVESGWS
jgi:tetrahydromethanopterin S-methyltransferase subunit A